MQDVRCSTKKVFSIPELVGLVSEFVEPGDIARLSRVCQHTFTVLVPTVWQRVNANHLLPLIKATTVREPEECTPIGPVQEIILDEVTDIADRFQRFNFYAPYVKTLEIHPDDELVCSVKGWSVLTDELQARSRPFLPNLEALRFLSSEIFVPRAPSAVLWITTFATNTLRVLSMRLCYPDASMRLSSDISMFLEVLAKRSPHVQALSFYPSKNCNQFDISTSTFLDPWYTRLGLFQSLRSLSFSSAALSLPCFLALGQLPCLASLEFFPGYFARYTLAADLDDNVNLPESSFSALRQLSLIHVSPRGMAKALSIRPLVQHITTLKAKILFYWYDTMIHRHDSWVTSEFLARLDNVPCLSNLQIEFEFSVSGSRVGLDMGEHIVPDILARLPLNMVKLSNVYLRTGSLGMDLGTVLSNVTRLELPAQYASLQELSYFAFMPNLRHLEVILNLATTYSPGLADIQIFLSLQAPLSVLWGTGLSEISTDDTVVVHNARVLRLLWPNIQRVAGDWVDNREWQLLAQTLGRFSSPA